MEKKQIFNTEEILGKTVKDIVIGDEDTAILFTDNTFIVIHAYANDGWHGSGSCEIENYKWDYDANFAPGRTNIKTAALTGNELTLTPKEEMK